MLSESEQILFDRISVFGSGFDLSAADAVVGGPPMRTSVEEHLASLVAKSLLTVSRATVATRFQQLEILRHFGETRLEVRGEELELRRRHLDHFVSWAGIAGAGLRGPDELRWHEAFCTEWHNLRNALQCACQLNDGDAACQLVCNVLWWAVTRLRLETDGWLRAVLELPSSANHPLRPIVLAGASFSPRSRAIKPEQTLC